MTKNAEEVWANCMIFIKDNLSEQAYRTWFSPIVPMDISDTSLSISVPSNFFYEWLEEHYVGILYSALTKELGKDAKLVYIVRMGNDNSNTLSKKISSTGKSSQSARFSDINNNSNADSTNPFVFHGVSTIKLEPQLNISYTFENFIEGDCNRIARSMGMTVASAPGKNSFNPLFIFGKTGLGKTHLSNAIGIKVKQQFPDKRVLYVSSDQFIQQYTEAVRKNKINDFSHFYQSIDVLIIDDIQFFSGKKGSQKMFFQIFNSLQQNGKQIVMLSDRSPVNMQDIEERLISRFKWGASAELLIPDYETRIKIAKHKIELDGSDINEDLIKYIARYSQSIRDIEGITMSLIAYSTYGKKEIDRELVDTIINRHFKKSERKITVDSIKKIVAEYFKMDIETLVSKTRKREIAQARQIAMYFCTKYTEESLSSIGTQIGNKNHATVLYAKKNVENLKEIDSEFKVYIRDLKLKLKPY